MTGPTREHRLDGLEPDNLLAFLALLGLLYQPPLTLTRGRPGALPLDPAGGRPPRPPRLKGRQGGGIQGSLSTRWLGPLLAFH